MLKIAQFIVLIVFILWTAAVAVAGQEAPHIGNIGDSQLLKEYQIFAKEYEAYQLTDTQKEQLAQITNKAHVDIYFGTWCHDSEREVPRFLKAFDQHPNISYTLVGLDYGKKEPAQRAKAAGVKYTPTFVITQNGKEVGRIIERPEKDMVYDVWQITND